jgi:hypothetical protein
MYVILGQKWCELSILNLRQSLHPDVKWVTLFELFQHDRLFARVAQAAKDRIGDNDGFVKAFIAFVDAQNERGYFDVVFADSPAAKTTGGVGRAVTVNTIHGDFLLMSIGWLSNISC